MKWDDGENGNLTGLWDKTSFIIGIRTRKYRKEESG